MKLLKTTAALAFIVGSWSVCIKAWPPLGKHIRTECDHDIGFCVEGYELQWLDALLQEIAHPVNVFRSHNGDLPRMVRFVTVNASSGQRTVSNIVYCGLYDSHDKFTWWWRSDVGAGECFITLETGKVHGLYAYGD